MKIFGISGSLRKASFNTALLHAAKELAPHGMTIEIFPSLAEIPPFDDDVRVALNGFPEPVQRMREWIASADGLLFVSPEYNYSLPGSLKNAIDWASRAPSQPFAGKPATILGASGSLGGTMRMQYHFRQIAVFVDLHVMNKPELFVRSAGEKITEGKLTDEATRKLLTDHLVAFAAWTKRFAR